MAIKKKKMEKRSGSQAQKATPARTTVSKTTTPSKESPAPVLTGIGRSLGTLLGRTKAYLMSGGKAEA